MCQRTNGQDQGWYQDAMKSKIQGNERGVSLQATVPEWRICITLWSDLTSPMFERNFRPLCLWLWLKCVWSMFKALKETSQVNKMRWNRWYEITGGKGRSQASAWVTISKLLFGTRDERFELNAVLKATRHANNLNLHYTRLPYNDAIFGRCP